MSKMAEKKPGIKKNVTGTFGRSMTVPGTAQLVTNADPKHELTGDQKNLMSRSCHTGSTGARPKETLTHNPGPTRQVWKDSTSTTTVHKVKPDVDSRSKEIDQLPAVYDAESNPEDKDIQGVARSKLPDNTYKDTAQAQVQPEKIPLKISLTVAYKCEDSNDLWKETKLSVKCNLETYMKWKYMINSPNSLDACQKNLIQGGFYDLQTRPKLKLTIGKRLSNDPDVSVITEALIDFVAEFDRSLTVETFEIKNEKAELCVQNIMTSKYGSLQLCYAEAIGNDKLCMAYMDSKADAIKQHVANLMSLELGPLVQMPSITIPLHDIWNKIAKQINLEDKFLKCSPNVKVMIEEVENQCLCHMEGPHNELQAAEERLNLILNRLLKINVGIRFKDTELLRKLGICSIIEKVLMDDRGLIAVALAWEENDIVVYGFEEKTLVETSIKVGKCIAEAELSISKSWIETNRVKELQKYINSLYPEKIACKFTGDTIYIVGIHRQVQNAKQMVKEKMSHRHASYEAKDVDLYHALKQIAPKIEDEYDVTMTEQEKQGFVLCGLEDNLKKAIFHLDKAKTKFVTKHLADDTSSSVEVIVSVPEEFYESKAGKRVIKTEEKTHNVTIETMPEHTLKKVDKGVDSEAVAVERTYQTEGMMWKFSKKRRIVLMKGSLKDSEATVQLVAIEKKTEKERDISKPIHYEGKMFIDIAIPPWIDGNHDEIQLLDGLLIKVLTKVVEDKEESVGIALDTSETWPKHIYLASVVEAISRFFKQNRKDNIPLSVVLLTKAVTSTKSDTVFNLTTKYIDDCLMSTSKVEHTKDGETLNVELISGELNKTKADVLVNTVSVDLDLTAGTVSAAILRSAGLGIQEECRRLCPKGLMDNEIVVTDGYKLPCKMVLHGNLNKFRLRQDGERYTELEAFMTACLKIASDYKYTSIAFPALGTGRLAYPVDMVALVMHTSVEKFIRDNKSTTLRKIIFVLYPGDKGAFQVFQGVNDKIGKPKELTDKIMRLKICGNKLDVDKAKAVLKQKVEQMHKAIKPLAPDISITQSILEVPRIAFIAFEHLHSDIINQLSSDGIKCIQRHEQLSLIGKADRVNSALEEVKRLVRKVQGLYQLNINVHSKDTKKMQQAIDDINSQSPNVQSLFCILDPVGYEVVIFGDSKPQIKEMQKMLQRKLDISSECKSQSLTNELDAAKSKENEDSVTGPSVRANPLVGRSFSWSKHARNMRAYQAGPLLIKVYEADILDAPVQCIVNAANADLQHGGGIAWAIARAAGDNFIRDSREIIQNRKGPLKVGEVVSTSAGSLGFECVLHAVGPCWYDYKPITEKSLRACEKDLFSAVFGCLKGADGMRLRSIAIPAISSALFAVPKDICCGQYAKAILQFSLKKSNLEEIHFVDIDVNMVHTIQSTFQTMITNGKPSPYNHTVYIESGHNTTGRSKPNSNSKELQSESPMPMVQMKTMGDKISYTFTKSCSLLVYTGNILTIDNVDAMVCSEDCTGKAGGIVAKKLLTIGGTDYAKDKNRTFSKKPQFGEVLITKGGNSKFKRIMHAIVTKRAPETLFPLFENIFEEVYRHNFTTVAMPLLGTGAGKSSPEPIAGMLLDSFHGFCKTHTDAQITVHVVNIVPETTSIVNRMFKERIGELQQRQGMHGVTSTYSEGIAIGDEAMENHGPSSLTSSRESGTFVDKPSSHRRLPDTPTAQNATVADKEMTSSQPDSTATEDNCVICIDKVDTPKKLKCGHIFCTDCIDQYFQVKPACPTCGAVCGTVTGDQPDGEMEIMKLNDHVPGYEKYATLAMTYSFKDGHQQPHHPRPNAWYKGISRTAYLPYNEEGQRICAMLKEAFNRRLVFTIGTSRTTGQEGVITWNDIHHKTDHRPNTQFGYPDPTYMARVTDELAAKGVTEGDIDKEFIKSIKALSGSKRLRIIVQTPT